MGDTRFKKMKYLSFQNLIDATNMEEQRRNPAEVQIFLLSRYFGIPKQQLKSMPITDIYPLIVEMNEYIDNHVNFSGDTPLDDIIDKTKEMDDLIEERTDILDIREHDE